MSVVYILEMEDLSHLGGPMGSEYTTHIGTKVFKSFDDAKKFAEAKIRRPVIFGKETRNRRYADCGHIGFSVSREEIP